MNANISANDFVTNANCTILNEFRVALFETYFLEHLIHYISVFERGAYIELNWIKNVKYSYNDCRCTWSKAMLVTLNWPQSLQYVFVNFTRICSLKTISLISDTFLVRKNVTKSNCTFYFTLALPLRLMFPIAIWGHIYMKL